MTKPTMSGKDAARGGSRLVGRRLAVCGWLLTALGIVLGGAWTYTGWYSIDLASHESAQSEYGLFIWAGCLRGQIETPPNRGGGQQIAGPREPQWYMDWTAFDCGQYKFRGPLTQYATVGLWPLIAASGCAGWLLLVLARRARDRLADDQCRRCGYAMVKQQTGEHAGTLVCPECGPQPATHSARRATSTPKARGPVWVASAWLFVVAAALVATTWVASRLWELRVTQLPWVVTVGGGAVLVNESHPDEGEVDGWVWSALPADQRGLAWRSNLDGYPNGPAFWSFDYRDTGRWRHMAVVWPLWAGAGAAGGWMLWSWRRGRA